MARDNDEIGVEAPDRIIDHRHDTGDQFRFVALAIGKKGGVPDIDITGVGTGGADRTEHRQTADAGIENQNGRTMTGHVLSSFSAASRAASA